MTETLLRIETKVQEGAKTEQFVEIERDDMGRIKYHMIDMIGEDYHEGSLIEKKIQTEIDSLTNWYAESDNYIVEVVENKTDMVIDISEDKREATVYEDNTDAVAQMI